MKGSARHILGAPSPASFAFFCICPTYVNHPGVFLYNVKFNPYKNPGRSFLPHLRKLRLGGFK